MPKHPVARPGAREAQRPSPSPRTQLRNAQPGDAARVRTLLAAESLPVEGVDDDLMQHTSVAVRGDTVVGSASIEVHGEVGLLRSVVVATSLRGRALGRRLVEDRIAWARTRGLHTVALFTETAHEFFQRHGFKDIPRAQLPRELHGSFEFGFCPSTSKSMSLDLRQVRARQHPVPQGENRDDSPPSSR